VITKFFLCALVLLAAVGSWSSAIATDTTVPAAERPGSSGGCGIAGAQTRISTQRTVDGKGRSRTFLLQVPATYDPARHYPLVFVFHGAGMTAQQSYSWGLQNAAGAGENAIFIYPNGISFQNYGVGWDDAADGYDLPMFDNILKTVETRYCSDAARVFVAGFSWGGDFAIALACHRGDAIRAVAANSTDDEYKDTSNYATYNGLPCQSRKRPAVRFVHAEGGDKEYPAPDFATTSKLFQYLNSCPGKSTSGKAGSALVCASYSSCASEYVECAFDARLGHTLPPNWAQDTWDYFSHF